VGIGSLSQAEANRIDQGSYRPRVDQCRDALQYRTMGRAAEAVQSTGLTLVAAI